MADGQSIFGTDTSRYQRIGGYDPGAFEVVNIEDPQWLNKWLLNRANGRPTGFYLWVYPGHNLDADTQWAIDKIRGAGIGDPELGLWADYEQAGIEPWQLDQFFRTADARGMKSGYYSSPHSLDHAPYLDRPFWLAVYPNANDGSFPGYGSLWSSSRPRPLNFWQYTSSNGTLDRNVVVDEAWFSQFIHGGAPAPPVSTAQELNDMYIAYDLDTTTRCSLVAGNVRIRDFAIEPRGFLGIPQAALEYAGDKKIIFGVTAAEFNLIDLASQYALTQPGSPGTPAPPLDLSGVKAAVQNVSAELAKLG